MIKYLKDLFIANSGSEEQIQSSNEHKLQIAACALLIEIANADDDFSEEEKTRIVEVMTNKFDLTEEEVNNIISRSEEEIKDSVSIYEFTDVLNKNINNDEKYILIKYLWHIAFADGNLDNYEDHFIKKISNNLHMHRKERIAAKLEVKKELGL